MSLSSEDLGGVFPTLSETHGGRPPEIVAFLPGSTTLERQGSPLATELQPVAKKDKDGQMGDRLNDDHRSAQGQAGMTASFRDTLVGKAVAESIKKGICELDVTVNDDDVIYGGSSVLPELRFSDRVHADIGAKLANSIIIRLLGKNHWLPCTAESNSISVEPSGYIANAIGRVVRIDYNTEDGKRGRFARLAVIVDLNRPLVSGIVIDGTHQDIEYEGLPPICYSCGKYGHAKESCGIDNGNGNAGGELENARDPKDLYGPWMQVVNRRRRALGTRSTSNGKAAGSQRAGAMGSRYAILRDNVEDAQGSMQRSDGYLDQGLESELVGCRRDDENPVHTEMRRHEGLTVGRGQSRSEQVALVEGMANGEARMELDNHDDTAENDVAPVLGRKVASTDDIVVSETTLNKEKHTAIRVGHELSGQVNKSRHGRILPASIRGPNNKPLSKPGANFKGGQRLNLKVKQNVDRGNGKPNFASRVSMLMSELDGVKQSGSTSATTSTGQRHGSTVQWRENGAFDHPNGDQTQSAPEIFVIMEPRISGTFADDFIRRPGYDFSYKIEATGFSGGIWILWRESVSVDVLVVTKQFIHARCSPAGNAGEFLLTCVYASPCRQQRNSSSERQGGSRHGSRVNLKFCDFIVDAGLIDMGFNGPQFTWKRGDLSQRLDRCLCNSRWYSEFAQSEVVHLQRLGSDHRPILLGTGMDSNQHKSSLFRYISASNDHPDFINLLKDYWDDSRSIGDNISNFQSKSREWSWTVFGHIDRRKNLLLSRIKGIEVALENGHNSYLEELEIALKRDLEHVLEQEESLWFQRARTSWIQSGDRNTAFFHASVISRKKRNRISMLKVSDESWCRDAQILKNHVADFFKTLFTSELHDHAGGTTLTRFPRINEEEMHPSPAPVGTMVDDDGAWDWGRLSLCLPRETSAKIATVPPPWIGMGSDNPRWRWEDNRKFTTKSAYGALREEGETNGEVHWRQIWKMPVPQRVRVRNVAGIGIGDDLWNTKFAVTCWLIWKSRCAQILGGVEFNSEGLARHCREAAAEFVAAHACRQAPRAAIQVPWCCPDRGWLAVNCDGAITPIDGTAAIGGVVRDCDGQWYFGFSRSIRRCSILMAELWAILRGVHYRIRILSDPKFRISENFGSGK
ncbi:hypothetical protein GQ457_14G000340 [Hibiscus cannabinus]